MCSVRLEVFAYSLQRHHPTAPKLSILVPVVALKSFKLKTNFYNTEPDNELEVKQTTPAIYVAILEHNPVSALVCLLYIFCSARTLTLAKADYLHRSDKSARKEREKKWKWYARVRVKIKSHSLFLRTIMVPSRP
jgi:hypothetical protein